MEKKEPIVKHLDELRLRLLIIISFFITAFTIGFLSSGRIINYVKNSTLSHIANVELITTRPADFIVTQINTGIFIAIIATVPIIFYELFLFAKPALTKKEKKVILCSVISGTLLFIAGIAFSYFVLIKVMIWFLAGLASSSGIINMWNVSYFLSFIFMTCITMGVVFELPIIVLALVKLEFIKAEDLRSKRACVIVLIFIFAAIITPPDPLTQIVVATPMVVLYEISILIAKIFT